MMPHGWRSVQNKKICICFSKWLYKRKKNVCYDVNISFLQFPISNCGKRKRKQQLIRIILFRLFTPFILPVYRQRKFHTITKRPKIARMTSIHRLFGTFVAPKKNKNIKNKIPFQVHRSKGQHTPEVYDAHPNTHICCFLCKPTLAASRSASLSQDAQIQTKNYRVNKLILIY